MAVDNAVGKCSDSIGTVVVGGNTRRVVCSEHYCDRHIHTSGRVLAVVTTGIAIYAK